MKQQRLSRVVPLLLTAVLVLSVICGCGSNAESLSTPQSAVSTPVGTAVTLKIVTEVSSHVGMMNDLLEELAESYQEEHQNVTIEIEILPTEDKAEERTIRLKQLRSEIMAGKGPDLYLLPGIALGIGCEELFSDVELSMYNGVFHEISAYYNADDGLMKEELNTKIMDAGTIGEARYILPLRYDFPILLVDEEAMTSYGLTLDDVSNSKMLMSTAIESGDTVLAYCAESSVSLQSYFPNLIDYENKELLLSQEEMADFMRNFQQLRFQMAEELFSEESQYIGNTHMENYVLTDSYWTMSNYPFITEQLSSAIQSLLVAKSLDEDISIYPLFSSDGSLIANITYWGAVGAGCEYPDVAYDFLRKFLSRESQWETTKSALVSSLADSFYENGVPVRNNGAVQYLTENVKNQISEDFHDEDNNRQCVQLQAVPLEKSELPVWDAEIDIVRFDMPLFSELQVQMNLTLNDLQNGFLPTGVDIDAMAAEFIDRLEYLLAEG